MELTSVETMTFQALPNLLVVQVLVGDELGLGDSFFGATAAEAAAAEVGANLVGLPAEVALERLADLPARGTSAVQRAVSALEIAILDAMAKQRGLPLWQLLGGACSRSITSYNTCAGSGYLKSGPDVEPGNYGLATSGSQYDDLNAFLRDPVGLAGSLLDQGFSAMKIWPFDVYAEGSGGQWISSRELDQALRPFRLIRDAYGSRIGLMAELHGMWSLPAALTICHALSEVEPHWVEDPVKPDRVRDWRRLRESVGVPLAGGETLGALAASDFIHASAAQTAIVDVGWVGGLLAANRLAEAAQGKGLGFALHNCGGPASFAASVHLASTHEHVLVQERIRAFESSWWAELVTGWPALSNGETQASSSVGHGVLLRETFPASLGCNRRTIRVGERV